MSTKIRLSNPEPSSTEYHLTSISMSRPRPGAENTGPVQWYLSVTLTSDIGETKNFSWGGLEAKRWIHRIMTGNFSTTPLSARLLQQIQDITGTVEGVEEGLTELETALLDGPGTILLADLPAWLDANATRENDARRLRDMDSRTTSKPIYDEHIAELLNGANSEPAV